MGGWQAIQYTLSQDEFNKISAGYDEDPLRSSSIDTSTYTDEKFLDIEKQSIFKHRGHELMKGEGSASVITCPYHAWTYHLDGKLRSARRSEHLINFNKDEICFRSSADRNVLSFGVYQH